MKIAVLNPNSSEAVTRSMAACLEGQQALTGHRIECHTLAGAPEGIESDADVALVAPMVADWVARHEADAYVIACFSDPGLAAARKAVAKPVFGIAESAYVRALVLGERFGVISLGPSSIARHRAMIERLGLIARLGGDRAVDMSVAEANDAAAARAAVRTVAQVLRDEDGAEVLILGCAGMGQQRGPLQAETGCIVVDPVQAAVSDAIQALDMNYVKGAVHA
ncbi:aspartate/glutamate racemase family protein [Poseidonocella sp. HB161398]|uniref:aspartate/glutamate racemase family protein n=1 Tax=Poseidonocella sp. HB161398 TaxID=2320855 RepID=UPI001108DDF9|nr:aspartate/glutamate racemase family protein [Poseidonocella sp. HB161398]